MPSFASVPTAAILPEDVEFILDRWEYFGLHRAWRGESLLLTGGTGFFGKWLTQALLAAEKRWPNGNQLTLVTRDRQRTLKSCPWLTADVNMIEGDIRSFKTTGGFSTVIHGAAAASQGLNDNHPLEMFDSIVDGSRHVLEVARASHCQRFQFISSGGVYGTQPPSLSHVTEAYAGAPDPLSAKSAYGEAKRAAEFLVSTMGRAQGMSVSVPRCFAFIGAYLPLDTHFAAGNFLLNVLEQKPIQIQGDGATVRSYMYAADLVIWLMVLLVKGESGKAYNLGAEKEYSIAALAQAIRDAGIKVFPERSALSSPIQIARKADPSVQPPRYVPSTRAARELGLDVWTSLESAAEKTLRWHKTNRSSVR